MLVISENLRSLTRELKIAHDDLIEEFSIKVCLDRRVRRMRNAPLDPRPVRFGMPFQVQSYFEDEEDLHGDLVLAPRECVLACSSAPYQMPPGYFGLIQTKGGLARLFVSATANDGQVEPGYCGKITLEITNHASYSVSLTAGANIAQMFIFRCSTDAANPYNGKYQNANGPTHYRCE